MDEPVTLARAEGSGGEVVLRQRGTGDQAIFELIVNGAFAMDSTETVSERELADVALPAGRSSHRVLVGGLGLGFTAAQLLGNPSVQLDVVELEGCLVDWAQQGLTPTLQWVAADERVRLHVGDIYAVISNPQAIPQGPWDAILLDVDNGPDFLIHQQNQRLYAAPALRGAFDRLTPGGVLAIWCQGPTPELLATLRSISPSAHERVTEVDREGRIFRYAIYAISQPAARASG